MLGRTSIIQRKTCFVIAPVGAAGSETRHRSDQIFRHIIRPVTRAHGYQAVRADQLDEPGVITDHIIRHLVDDYLVIADLSEHNPNVFYELAIRHVTRKPVIQLIDAAQRIPFDVVTTRVIQVDHHDMDDVKVAKSRIAAQIQSIESDITPSGSPADNVLAMLLRQLQTFVPAEWGGQQIHHVSLPVRNVARSKRFYRDVVGLREIERPKHFNFGGAWFVLPSGQQLHILKNNDGTFRRLRKHPDYRDCHFAIRVDDFKKARARFKRKGHELLEIDDLKKYRYVGGYLVDPDGHVIEINAKKDVEAPMHFVD